MNLMHKLRVETRGKQNCDENGNWKLSKDSVRNLSLCAEDGKINVYFRVTGDVN